MRLISRRVAAAVAALVVVAATAHAQGPVVVLVRHAEKAAEPGPDPALSDAGTARAAALAALPEVAGARAIYVTQYRRTALTAAPTAARRGVTPVVMPVGADVGAFAAQLAAAIRARPATDTVLVVGHSNTVPAVIAALGAPAPVIDDAQYARLFVVTLGSDGRATLREAAYGGAPPAAAAPRAPESDAPPVAKRLAEYTSVRLTTDLTKLTPNERRVLPLLVDAAREMDAGYWLQSTGPRDSVMATLRTAAEREFADLNYGPWDRLRENAPFAAGVAAKPAGARFYPTDMTAAELNAAGASGGAHADSLKALYTVVRRENGQLVAVPYHVAFAAAHGRAAAKLRAAAKITTDTAFRRYLTLRATALETDDYQPSDFAWMAMKDNSLDLVIGPIETYEDALFGYKAADEAYVLVKDRQWSKRLAHYAALLPGLQRGLPVEDRYKAETPGTSSDLNAYDAVYYAGQANAGAKTIAINLPNDEEVQLKAGSRRLQLKNAMRAKFDRILVPIADRLIAADQRRYINFDAFFENTMFHEVAHGLGIKNTINGSGTVRAALKERAGGLEEEKADILGLYMVVKLAEQGELSSKVVDDNFVTFLAGLFRSVRFGAADAHGRANMATFNFFQDAGAFTRDPNGTYRVDFPKMRSAMDALSAKILVLQGNGDYAGVSNFMATMGVVRPELQKDLGRLSTAGIPVDIRFVQGGAALK